MKLIEICHVLIFFAKINKKFRFIILNEGKKLFFSVILIKVYENHTQYKQITIKNGKGVAVPFHDICDEMVVTIRRISSLLAGIRSAVVS